jgi:hypothetical protein
MISTPFYYILLQCEIWMYIDYGCCNFYIFISILAAEITYISELFLRVMEHGFRVIFEVDVVKMENKF